MDDLSIETLKLESVKAEVEVARKELKRVGEWILGKTQDNLVVTQPDVESIKEIIDQNLPPFSNQSDRPFAKLTLLTKSLALHTMLDFGLRETVIPHIIFTYDKAYEDHFFEIAADMAFLLAEHYSIYCHDNHLATKYWSLCEEATTKNHVVKKTIFKSGFYSNNSGKDHTLQGKDQNQINGVLSEIEKSYSSSKHIKYWFIIFLYQIKEAESRSDFNQMILRANKALSRTTLVQSDKRIHILNHLLRAYIGLGKYKQVLSYVDEVKSCSNWSLRASKCMLSFMQAALNLKDTKTVLELYHEPRDLLTSTELQTRKNLLYQYMHLIDANWDIIDLKCFDLNTEHFDLRIAILIAKLWYEVGAKHKPSKNTLAELSYVENHIKGESRTWIFIQLLLLKASSYRSGAILEGQSNALLSKMKILPADIFRGEIINYELAWCAVNKEVF